MKQFEKWLKETGYDKSGRGFQEGYKRAMMIAWKAALQYGLNELRHDANGFFNIIKELEDG